MIIEERGEKMSKLLLVRQSLLLPLYFASTYIHGIVKHLVGVFNVVIEIDGADLVAIEIFTHVVVLSFKGIKDVFKVDVLGVAMIAAVDGLGAVLDFVAAACVAAGAAVLLVKDQLDIVVNVDWTHGGG